jgi:hypothetical protein
MVKCACISKLEINGDMFPGSSGVTAPIGVQFLSKLAEILSALVVLTTSNKTAMLFASCGCRVVSVALSLKAPYPVSQQYSLIAAFKETARLFHVADRLVVS